MFEAEAAARFVDEAHRSRARYQNLPDGIAPSTVAEAYAAQAALRRLWTPRLGAVAGLKIATTTKVMQALMGIDHPCMGTIFASCVHASPATIAKTSFINVRIECELAVRLGRDLPNAGAPYTRESARAAVSHIMAAFELIEDRHADYKTSKEIADELGVSHRTIETHRTNICQKLELKGSHSLMKFALTHKSEL